MSFANNRRSYTAPPTMTFTYQQARLFLLPFGKFAGMELQAIAQSDDGLQYLCWLLEQDWMQGVGRTHVLRAVTAFINAPETIGQLSAARKAKVN